MRDFQVVGILILCTFAVRGAKSASVKGNGVGASRLGLNTTEQVRNKSKGFKSLQWIKILTGNPVFGEQEYGDYMYRDEQGFCYYAKPIGENVYLKINDKNDLNGDGAYRFRCSDSVNRLYDRTNGATSPRNNAFKWGSEAVTYLQRVSNTSWNSNLTIQVHYRGIHAAWTGTRVELGDGDSRFFYPLSTPDVIMHEVAHAFTSYVSNLTFASQSGAIYKAYSDMAVSAFLDFYFGVLEDQVYKIGHYALKMDSALRDLCDPRNPLLLLYKPGKPILISALDYTNTVSLYNASSLYSKAFCELSRTNGWNIQQAFKAFTNANVKYWRANETFNSGACGVKKAAYDLMNTVKGATDVDNAFAVVDIACVSNDWMNLAPVS